VARRPRQASSLPHTAVVEIKGEIAAGGEASAEFVVAAHARRV
jgi:protease-4